MRFFSVVSALAITLTTLFSTPALAAAVERSVTLSFDLSHHPADQEARLWVPYPVSNADQSVTDIKVVSSVATSVTREPVDGNLMLFAAWPAGSSDRTLTMTFNVTRTEVKQSDLPNGKVDWNPADYAEYLKATSLGPIDGDVAALAKKITKGKKGVLAKARAIYDWTCDNMYRDPDTRGCGKGDVCALLSKPGGKCTDISSVFIALCRAAGVPAREVFGLRLGKNDGQDVSTWQHCWSEFFLPGYGWVQVDPADVRKKMLVDKLAEDSKEAAEAREYFWNGVDAYRFVIAAGRDITLNPPQAGMALNTFGYPYAEVGGMALDFYDPKAFGYTFVTNNR